MLQPNETVGRFVIRGPLAQGASSEVYHAEDTLRVGSEVALKILRQDRQTDMALRVRMINETEVLRLLDLPGVVRLIDAGEHRDGRLYLASELMPTSLGQVGGLDPAASVRLVAQLFDVLGALHQRGFVHRDIKPQNILIDHVLRPMLTDFGVAKLPVVKTAADHQFLPWSTETHAFVGTYGYAAPEQITSAKDVDGRADVYALGVVLYELLAKRRPFVATTRGQLITLQLNQSAPLLSSFVPALPDELVSVVARFLDRDRERRPDAREAARLLFALRWRSPRRHTNWLRLSPLVAVVVLPTPEPLPRELTPRVEYQFLRFEGALFTETVKDAADALRGAEDALKSADPARDFLWARYQYKAAALAKERGHLMPALQLYLASQAAIHPFVRARPAPSLKALSICADGIGELSYHLGQYERALQQYADSSRTLLQTLAAAVSQRQVPSFLEYQRALVLRDQGAVTDALRALVAAEEHQRILIAEPTATPADLWQLARVLSLRGALLGKIGNLDEAWSIAQEALRLAQAAVQRDPREKRFRLGHFAALLTIGALAHQRGQDSRGYDQSALVGLRALAAGDPDNGQWAHAFAEALVQVAERRSGPTRRELALAASEQFTKMSAREQWQDDVHIRVLQSRAVDMLREDF